MEGRIYKLIINLMRILNTFNILYNEEFEAICPLFAVFI